MKTSDFDFHLPDEQIAQRPAPRGESRLFVPGDARPHRRVKELPELLRPDDLLVVNDTRVIPARLFARRRPGGGRAELLLVERCDERTWDALVKPGRKVRPGMVLDLGESGADAAGPSAEIVEVLDDGQRRIVFSEPIEPHLERLGHIPLPPYINRDDDDADRERYQTVYAKNPGAVAAPTAGLHFTPELLERLEARGIGRVPLTLHVGIGTFKPVAAERIEEHHMHAERFEISPATAAAIRATRASGGRIVAIGTTVVRALESAARDDGTAEEGAGRTEIFITPGYRFQVVDVLFTNFHLPRSTLLMMVSAFAGQERILTAYREAIAAGYRFFSYGDAMLLEREPTRRGRSRLELGGSTT